MRSKLSLSINSIKQSSQIKPNENKNNKHLFNHLLKQYKTVLSQTNVGEFLNLKQVHNVLVYMGYIELEIR